MTAMRKTIFWVHLIVGVAAVISVVIMAAAGVVLSYERQARE